MWGKTLIAALFGFGLTGCQTTEQMLTTAQTELNDSFVGQPLSDYIMLNGVFPQTAFDMPGVRVFVFGQPCFSWWYARRVGAGSTPANFIVERIEVRGYCRTR